jgi:hypothetical protein
VAESESHADRGSDLRFAFELEPVGKRTHHQQAHPQPFGLRVRQRPDAVVAHDHPNLMVVNADLHFDPARQAAVPVPNRIGDGLGHGQLDLGSIDTRGLEQGTNTVPRSRNTRRHTR